MGRSTIIGDTNSIALGDENRTDIELSVLESRQLQVDVDADQFSTLVGFTVLAEITPASADGAALLQNADPVELPILALDGSTLYTNGVIAAGDGGAAVNSFKIFFDDDLFTGGTGSQPGVKEYWFYTITLEEGGSNSYKQKFVLLKGRIVRYYGV